MPYHNDAWPPWTPGTADVPRPRVYVGVHYTTRTGRLEIAVVVARTGRTDTVYLRVSDALPAVRDAALRFLRSGIGIGPVGGRMPVPILLDMLMDAEPGDPGLEEAAAICC